MKKPCICNNVPHFSINAFKVTDRNVTIVNEMEIFWMFSFSSIHFWVPIKKTNRQCQWHGLPSRVKEWAKCSINNRNTQVAVMATSSLLEWKHLSSSIKKMKSCWITVVAKGKSKTTWLHKLVRIKMLWWCLGWGNGGCALWWHLNRQSLWRGIYGITYPTLQCAHPPIWQLLFQK